MEKGLCLAAVLVAALMLIIFGLDLALKWPFGRAGLVQDIVLVIAAALIIWMGYETWRELA